MDYVEMSTFTAPQEDGTDITFEIVDKQARESAVTPSYVIEEADRVAKQLLTLQNENTITFACVADVHINYGSSPYDKQTQESAKHAGMAINHVASQVGIDFMVNLGDNLWGTNTKVEYAKNEQLICNQLFYEAFRGYPQFRLVGNHDANLWDAYIPTNAVYHMNGKYNDYDVASETKIRGYGYKDFENYKLRVIALNTSDYIDRKGGYALSDEQKLWFMRTLDLSDKEDVTDWQILILSHIPLDYPSGDFDTPDDVDAILLAYSTKSSVNITAGTYDYSEKGQAKIIANIYGHLHNFSYGSMEDNNILRVGTPNTCFYNSGSSGTGVDESYQPNETYNKTAKSARDTTVTFYTIDLENMIIYSTNYGAGYDRQFSYQSSGEVEMATITNILTNANNSNTAKSIPIGTPYSCTITPDENYESVVVTVTMGGVVISDEVYADGIISIASVTGDVVITATATAIVPFEQTVDDLAVAIRSEWNTENNSDGTTTVTLPSHNQSGSLAVTTANSGGAFTDREQNTVYMIPVPVEATKVKVSTTDTASFNLHYNGVKVASDGTFSREFQVGDSADWECSWDVAGLIDYILIECERTDGSSWAWGYDDSQFSVKFTNY